jgi:hypothetical protein
MFRVGMGFFILLLFALVEGIVAPEDALAAIVFAGVAVALNHVRLLVDNFLHVGRHRRLLARVEKLAASLDHGGMPVPGFASGGRTLVTGRLGGRTVAFSLQWSEPRTIAIDIPAPDAKRTLDLAPPSLLGRLRGETFRIRAGDTPPPSLGPALREIFSERGFARVRLGSGWLRAEAFPMWESELDPERLLAAARALARIAEVCERRRKAGPVHVSGSDASEARCPWCRESFFGTEEVETCRVCRTAHHTECFGEAGGCTVFGCKGAPPRLSVRS